MSQRKTKRPGPEKSLQPTRRPQKEPAGSGKAIHEGPAPQPGSLIGKVFGRRAIWLIVLVIVGYSLLWSRLATPYRVFPSDDRRFISHMTGKDLFHIEVGYEPVAEFVMRFYSLLAKLFVPESPSLLVYFSIACFAATMALIAFLARRVTGDWIAALIAVALYGVAAWPVTYLFMGSYAPLLALFATFGFTFLLCSPAKPRTEYLFAAGAGVAAVACVGCSMSGAIAALSIGWIALVVRPLNRRANWIPLLCFGAVALIAMGLLWALFGKDFSAHVDENIHTGHYDGARAKFGEVPPVPFLSGIWILWTYSKMLAIAFIIGSIAASLTSLYMILKKRRFAPDSPVPFLTRLSLAVWIGMLAIDVLPTTKLGRAHFFWFPIVCLSVATFIWWLTTLLPGRQRWIGGAVAVFVFIVSGAEGISRSSQIRESRIALPNELLKNFPEQKQLLVLREDPHARFLAGWLTNYQFAAIGAQELFNHLNADRSTELLLLIGPTGPASGNSILSGGYLPNIDFPVDEFARQTGAELKSIPYYAFTPAFCMEEEICEGLLYQGSIPDPAKDAAKNLRLLRWPVRPRTGAAGNTPGTVATNIGH